MDNMEISPKNIIIKQDVTSRAMTQVGHTDKDQARKPSAVVMQSEINSERSRQRILKTDKYGN